MPPSRFLMPALLAALIVTAIAGDAMAQSGVDFSKVDTLGSDFVTWLRGNIASVFFTVALAVWGYFAAFSKISWTALLLVALGAFLVFGGPNIVADLKAIFS